MKKRVFAVLFARQNGYASPVDPKLHQLAVVYADKNLDYKLRNLAAFDGVWATCIVNEKDEPIEVTGLMCGTRQKWDFPVCRYQDPESGELLFNRVEGFLHDTGSRGQEVFIFLSEGGKPENLCPLREEMLKKYNAEPSHRYSVIVR